MIFGFQFRYVSIRLVLVSTLFSTGLWSCEEPRRSKTAFVPPVVMTLAMDASVGSMDASTLQMDAGVPQVIVDSGTMPLAVSGTLVRGLDISEIAIYQGVKISLMKYGSAITPLNAPIVEGREALLRIFVNPQSDWSARLIRIKLELQGASFGSHQMMTEKKVTAPTSESFLASSVNFEIPGSYMVGDLRWSVALEEIFDTTSEGRSDHSRFPSSGMTNMDIRSAGENFKLVIVPIQYNNDESYRLPSVMTQQIERYREGLYTLYPTPEVEVTVRSVMEWEGAIERNGEGWGELLDAVASLRRNDGVAKNVYYYGIFNPRESRANFCRGGCVAGLSVVPTRPGNDRFRASIGLGYAGDDAVGTMVHEIGHAHGRRHSPCGLGGRESDDGYPYSGAVLGVWGYDLIHKVLIDPNEYKDLMSYCDPRWISDYQYKALFDRMSAVDDLSFRTPKGGVRSAEWVSAIIGIDGTARWGANVHGDVFHSGEFAQVNFLSQSGRIESVQEGAFFPFSHISGGIYVMPKPSEGVYSIRLPSGQILLRP